MFVRIAALLILVQVFLPVEGRDYKQVFKDYMSHFQTTRNTYVNPAEKTAARDYVIQAFKNHGLDTWTEKFSFESNQTCKCCYPGVNVIGRVRGRYTGTSQDKVVIIGSHYDTVHNSTGADDNGSGMMALLHALRLYTSPDKINCEQDYTLLFVAFDLEEGGLCGSYKFVSNFSRYLNMTGGKIQGAYIMDTVMNYNTTEDSQDLPSKQAIRVMFPEAYASISKQKFRGNFLAVIGRKTNDTTLIDAFVNNYLSLGQFRTETFKLPFNNRPIDYPNYHHIRDFLRSDHRSFWNHQKSWPAVFLTDTANFRGHMTMCYHQMCDDMSHVTSDMVISMLRIADALAEAGKLLSGQACTMKTTSCNTGNRVISDGKKVITSPYYPKQYPNNITGCVWSQSGTEHTITFDDFEMETSVNCSNDYLEIRDGGWEDSYPLIGRFCGSKKPSQLKIKTKSGIYLRYRTDAYDAYKGFKITWNAAPTIFVCRFLALALATLAVIIARA